MPKDHSGTCCSLMQLPTSLDHLWKPSLFVILRSIFLTVNISRNKDKLLGFTCMLCETFSIYSNMHEFFHSYMFTKRFSKTSNALSEKIWRHLLYIIKARVGGGGGQPAWLADHLMSAVVCQLWWTLTSAPCARFTIRVAGKYPRNVAKGGFFWKYVYALTPHTHTHKMKFLLIGLGLVRTLPW